MRTGSVVLLIGLLAWLTGCDPQAPATYTEQTIKQRDYARISTYEARVQEMVRGYQAKHGKYPKTLDQLDPEYMPELPPGWAWDYNNRKGTVKAVEE